MTSPLPLVKALTLHAHALQEASLTTKPAVAKIVLATAQQADEAARLVQHNKLDQLSPKQQQIISEVQS